jgi:hypothetical protein
MCGYYSTPVPDLMIEVVITQRSDASDVAVTAGAEAKVMAGAEAGPRSIL